MTNYHANFCILGEVVDMMSRSEPDTRLLIDISAQPEGDQNAPGFVYRTSFFAADPELIEQISDHVALGDVIEATGSFWQSGYVPHRDTCIDTMFCLTSYKLIRKRAAVTFRHSPFLDLVPAPILH